MVYGVIKYQMVYCIVELIYFSGFKWFFEVAEKEMYYFNFLRDYIDIWFF